LGHKSAKFEKSKIICPMEREKIGATFSILDRAPEKILNYAKTIYATKIFMK
jgi:hypothetical protein